MSVCVMCVCVCVCVSVCVGGCVRLPSLCFKSCSVFLKSKRVVRSVLSALPLPFSLLFLLVSAFRTAVYCQPVAGGGVPARSGWGGVMQSVTGSQNPVSTLRKSSRKTSHFSVSSLVFPGSSSMRMQLFSYVTYTRAARQQRC